MLNGAASVEFIVFGDGRELWRSGVCKLGEKPRECRVKLEGVKSLDLVVTDAGDGISCDQADWADAKVTLQNGKEIWLGDLPIIDTQSGQLSRPATPRSLP